MSPHCRELLGFVGASASAPALDARLAQREILHVVFCFRRSMVLRSSVLYPNHPRPWLAQETLESTARGWAWFVEIGA